ncbi:hypothetical protein RKD47_006708 [Streptomyces albogriseolus]
MTDDSSDISRSEVEAFIRKLEAWGAGLDEKEKVLLQALLTPPEDTHSGEVPSKRQGFNFERYNIEVPLESLLGRFRYERKGGTVFIQDPGPQWVRFIQRQPPK